MPMHRRALLIALMAGAAPAPRPAPASAPAPAAAPPPPPADQVRNVGGDRVVVLALATDCQACGSASAWWPPPGLRGVMPLVAISVMALPPLDLTSRGSQPSSPRPLTTTSFAAAIFLASEGGGV